jgi:hypothetical protein
MEKIRDERERKNEGEKFVKGRIYSDFQTGKEKYRRREGK